MAAEPLRRAMLPLPLSVRSCSVRSMLALPLLVLGCGGPEKAAPADSGDGGRDSAPVEVGPGLARAPEDLVAFVGEPARLDASTSEGEVFTWELGDGATAEGAVIEHTYTNPGRYRVVLTADGAPPHTDSLVVTVVHRPLAEAPVASSMLVRSGEALWAALTDFDLLAVVSDDGEVLRVPTCRRPLALAAGAGADAGRVAVACRDAAWVHGPDGAVVEVRAGEASAALLFDGLWTLGPEAELTGPDGSVQVALPGRALLGWRGADGAPQVLTAAFKSPADHALWWDGAPHRMERHPGPDSDTDARGVPNLLGAGALRPDGRALVWGGLKANTERGRFNEGADFAPDRVVRAVVQVVDPLTGTELDPPLLDNRDRVGALAWTPLGETLLVAYHGAQVVDLLDPFSMQRIGGWQHVGHGLDGLWTDGEVAWVLASWSRELVAFDLRAGNAQVELARIRLVDEEVLPADVLAGAQVFFGAADPRMSRDGYISCGSCHPDGGEDGRVWDFTERGEGLRNTQALRAAPAGGPFHWTANFDEGQDFEGDIRLHQGGDGFLSDEDWAVCADGLGPPKAGLSPELDALAAYLAHLRLEAPAEATVAPADLAVFAGAGCVDCHAGPEGTDAAWTAPGEPVLHDVGTLGPGSGSRRGAALTGLRTPPLRGLRRTAPYLHDGSAPDLGAAVRAHEGVELRDDELDAIVRVLSAL
jgi:hypothetical protein